MNKVFLLLIKRLSFLLFLLVVSLFSNVLDIVIGYNIIIFVIEII